MSKLIGEQAPDFNVTALVGRDFEQISLDDYKGQWVVLFFYPMDFTFVCPTEIAEFNERLEDFEDRDAAVLGGSTDTEYSHLGWVKAEDDISDLDYPLFADTKKEMTKDFNIYNEEEGVAYRGTFIIDPEGIVRWVNVNELNVGRNVDEVLRVLDALQTDELCPCGWEKGEETIAV